MKQTVKRVQKTTPETAPQTAPQKNGKVPTGAGHILVPNRAPHQGHAPGSTYRVRSTGSGRANGRAREILVDRKTMRLRSEIQRQRMRLSLVLVGMFAFVVMLASVGAYIVAAVVIGQVAPTIDDVFETPVAQPPRITSGPDLPEGTPAPITFPDWEKNEPVNILLIGLDERDGVEESRTDTQIIVHIDPEAKTAAMVSLPRDLWVEIPGYGEDRINAAYKEGEKEKPGSGPSLTKATVRENFGIPIDYYAMVNFQGFEKIVDTLGGVTIDVPRPLIDNSYPFQEFGATRIYVPSGLQRMDGHTALEYARSRHVDSDLGRNSRQQQVLLAIKEQVLSLNLLANLPELVEEVGDAVRTDLTLTQVGSLAQLSRSIGADALQTVVIDAAMIRQTTLPSGAVVLLPRWDVIRPAITQAFSDPRLGKEAARLSVKNGTWTSGTARKVRDLLAARGVYTADLSNASDRGMHPTTTITDYTGGKKPYTLLAITTLLGIPPDEVEQAPANQAPMAADGRRVDILVMVGDDRIAQ